MKAILWQYLKDILRNPWELIMMLSMTVLFAFVVSSGTDDYTEKVDVLVYSTSLTDEELNKKVDELNENPQVNFSAVSQKKALEQIDHQSVEGAVHLNDSSYELVVQREGTLFVPFLEPMLDQYFTTNHLIDLVGDEAVTEMAKLKDTFTVYREPMQKGSQLDGSLHSLFGFALYFSIFTISFAVSSILQLKENGIWQRLILSPTTKTSMYVGNMIFAFIIGYVQIALVLILFKFIFGYSFYGGFWKLFIIIIPFLFAVMSIGIFLSGLVTNSRQLTAIVPLFATSAAMLGGAFWPLDIVESDWMLKLSYISPLMYGMEMMKGVTVYNWSWNEFLLPAAILFFIGAAVIGIGLHLMERRTVK